MKTPLPDLPILRFTTTLLFAAAVSGCKTGMEESDRGIYGDTVVVYHLHVAAGNSHLYSPSTERDFITTVVGADTALSTDLNPPPSESAVRNKITVEIHAPGACGLTMSPGPTTFELVVSNVTLDAIVREYLHAITTTFQEKPLLVKVVDEGNLPPGDIKLRRHFEKSHVLKRQVYYERTDYEITAWALLFNGTSNTNRFDIRVRVLASVDVSLSGNTQSFHTPSDAQLEEYRKAIEDALDRAREEFIRRNVRTIHLVR